MTAEAIDKISPEVNALFMQRFGFFVPWQRLDSICQGLADGEGVETIVKKLAEYYGLEEIET